MASVVDICNMALSSLGAAANVSSIDPPEGSPEADSCGRFYPLARDVLLASHAWGFATVMANLSRLSNTYGLWRYAYACPTNILSLLGLTNAGKEVESFERATSGEGSEVILCNYEKVLAKYTTRITDTTFFPPLFVQALSWQLASMLAGPIIRGESGAQQAQRCSMFATQFLSEAKAADAQQNRITRPQESVWLSSRNGKIELDPYPL